MKIQLLSDLHLETDPSFLAQPTPGADLLVLAGDIGSYRQGSRLTGTDFGLSHYSPRHGWPTPVVFVPGNHEYDNLDFDEAHARLYDLCQALDIQWLERETCVMDGVRLIGTTLWTDFDALAADGDTLGVALKKRAKAFRAADFYLEKAEMRRHGAPFMAEQMREQGLLCQQWLDAALRVPFDGPTVAITHFAPTLASADPRYGVTPGTAGFCSNLDALLPLADVWMHGHLHCAQDYMKDGCRVVANPLGYAKKGEQQDYAPDRLWDVSATAKASTLPRAMQTTPPPDWPPQNPFQPGK
ncbi:metallophosphoesterase [Achromobacter seleniivolatilans]|uniref:Metallophosphoesterase n=1 Tax=Achromobacter seleniivolatilans TaxID=3047478 RepID=A0ABY9LZV4_9BURK|nr:metallophosphoesterase [Achromobacter sp. R39]WMD20304.1 metallophosphoesterase [Achromobacter sp. R39]